MFIVSATVRKNNNHKQFYNTSTINDAMSNNPKSRPPNIIRHYLQISSIATQVELLCPTCKLAPLVTRLGRSLLAKPASTSCLSNVKKCQGEDRKGSRSLVPLFNRCSIENDQIMIRLIRLPFASVVQVLNLIRKSEHMMSAGDMFQHVSAWYSVGTASSGGGSMVVSLLDIPATTSSTT